MNLLLGLPFILSVFVPYRQMTSFAAADKPFPIVTAKAYIARIMIVVQEKGIIEYATEKYDQTQNKASMEVVSGDKADLIVMDYDDGNMYYVSYSWPTKVATTCSIIGMKKAHDDPSLGLRDNFDFFGGWQGGQTDGKPHMFSTRNIFKMGGNNPFVYKGTKTVDGIVADWWSTTIKWSSDKDNLKVDYYFTPPDWKLKGYRDTGSALPIRIEIQGNHDTGGLTQKKIHHIYEYVNFESSDGLTADAFSIPDGESCNSMGSEKSKSVPTVPDVISYSREVIDSKGNVKLEDVIHDKKRGFTRINSDTKILYDFNDGVHYSVEQNGRCTGRAIDPLLDPDAKMNGNYVQDIGPSEFSLLDNRYVFTGQKITRFLDSYSWGGTLDSKPFDVHFAKLNWNYPGYNSNSTPPPLSMVSENLHYNFFDFKTTSSNILSTNSIMSYCRSSKGIKRFKLVFFSKHTYDYLRLSSFSELDNGHLFTTAIAKAAGVKYLRVHAYANTWDQTTQHVNFKVYLYGATKPQYLYRRSDNFAIQNDVPSQTVKVSKGSYDNAVKKSTQLCEDRASSGKFLCRNFDLCNNTDGSYSMKMYLTLPSSAVIGSSSSCNHFARSVDNKNDISLTNAVDNLKNAVQKGLIKVTINYTTTRGYAYTALLTAFRIDASRYKRIDGTSRMASQKFRYQGWRYSIIKTEVLQSVLNSQDCANECLGRIEYECKAYAFCRSTKQCFLSKSLPKEDRKPIDSCVVMRRRYTADFQLMRGKTVVTKGQTVIHGIKRLDDCAMTCLKYTTYNCESLDYCYNTKTCVLHNSHIYSLSTNEVQNTSANGCFHLSKNYLLDFQVTKNTALVNSNKLQTISVSGPSECAYLCRTGYSGQGCVQFDYCSGSKQCRIAGTASQKDVSYLKESDCDTFTLAANTKIIQSGSSSSVSYSNGSLAGLAIAMIIIGMALGALVIYVLHKKRIVDKIAAS